ncbi:TPA_exp: Uncharacterized protein A8136_2694 [Trichophyton benhamiae CBS 112371]|uniref:Uncharacterized protein n=1 Tax=Arthroderma benhamiae (strain ATCC MYA-4681 / CBS 112371) TaxID=663331 RepID=D4AL38_ARTBC|nr:uncharacterized protein ARB_05034 [Trichophyton benhamiae CBS 112371]EFE36097.1 conserved hypothetical protein [Trichophyton benhamiae CBS 112371]DAA78909.1 TPA_exp: Uncharacterized protein A8136_2694 [Trichophyton benhamiae CBS 112371]
MAFRLPDQTPQRQHPYRGSSRSLTTPPNVSQPQARADEEDSQEWVLFSPVEAQSTATHSHTASTERTPRTAGLSRLSDFGSLETAAQSSGPLDSEGNDGETEGQEGQLQDTGVQEDDVTELDSLDDGLQAFRDPQLDQSGGPAMLPTHDGLGTFSPSGVNVQEQLWQHEQFNPRRIGETRQRSSSSVQRHLDNANESQPMGIGMERERWQRIEQWRMEQSKVLLQEIEKETRRRRQRKQRAQSKGSDTMHPLRSIVSEDTTSKTDASLTASQAALDATVDATPSDETDSDESFWQRITRRVINGLIGIDDSLLAVIFGESLVSDTTDSDTNSTSPQDQPRSSFAGNNYLRTTTLTTDSSVNMVETIPNIMSSSTRDGWWQERLLERIARELGILVHQIYEHPGAFTAYMRTNIDPSTEYAGMPISQPTATPTVSAMTSRRESHSSHENTTSVPSPTFHPTMQDAATSRHAALWGIEEDVPAQRDAEPSHILSESERRERDREYWERELNIKMVFRYLRNRFAATATGDASSTQDNDDTIELTSPQHRAQRQRQHDPIRAAIIRQHHPLVARAEANSRFRQQSSRIYRHQQHHRHHHHMRGTISPSCASQSQSTRKSVSTKRTGSSRHYWDIGGSAGSSSAPLAVGGGMGSWGDI